MSRAYPKGGGVSLFNLNRLTPPHMAMWGGVSLFKKRPKPAGGGGSGHLKGPRGAVEQSLTDSQLESHHF